MCETRWLYKRTEPGLWTVGYYAPSGTWEPETDHDDPRDAGLRVHWLNGGECAPECQTVTPVVDDVTAVDEDIIEDETLEPIG